MPVAIAVTSARIGEMYCGIRSRNADIRKSAGIPYFWISGDEPSSRNIVLAIV